MANGYLTFLDYLELRRRVEKRLTSGNWFLLHTLVFGFGATFIGSMGYSPIYDEFHNYFIRPEYGHWVALWSGILFLHGLWTYWQSGARGGRRDQVIESEMRERVQNDDMYLSDHPKDLFRLHGLLNEDIRKRASAIPLLFTFIILNALIWIPWAMSPDVITSFAWAVAPLLIVPLVLALMWNMWRRGRHEAKLRVQMEQLFGSQQSQPFEDDYDSEREVRLSESDELVTVDDYMMKRKRS